MREKLLTTSVGLKAGLAVIEAYTAGDDFQASLRSTYDAKPELDTREMALLQNLKCKHRQCAATCHLFRTATGHSCGSFCPDSQMPLLMEPPA